MSKILSHDKKSRKISPNFFVESDTSPRNIYHSVSHTLVSGCVVQVCLVRWNEPYQKLASCDVAGVINVWKRHDDRWMIELINDRKVEVSAGSWDFLLRIDTITHIFWYM